MNKQSPNLTREQSIMLAGALREAKDIACSCGGLIFNQGTKLKLLSKLLIGADEDQLVPIPAFFCIKCLKELNLEEEKPNDEIVLDFKKNAS